MRKISWRNLRIGLKYGIALGVMIALFTAAAGFVTKSLFDIKTSVEDIDVKGKRSVTLTYMTSLFTSKALKISDYTQLKSKILIDEYDTIKNEFDKLHTAIEPTMNDKESKFVFNIIKENNKKMDDIFQNKIIHQIQQDDIDGAVSNIIKTTALSKSNAQLFERLKTMIDSEREKSISNAYENIKKSIMTLVISILFAAISGSLLVIFISRGVRRNLNQVVHVASKVSEGELTVEKINYHGKDEIGQLSEAINNMLHNLQNIIQTVIESALIVDDESNNFKRIVDEVKQGSEQIAATMQEMSAGAQEQASSASEIANSIYSLTELIRQANINKQALENSSQDILNVIETGSMQMETSIGNMNQINDIIQDSVFKVKQLDENSQKISALVQMISDISEQTNLLALNAAIEAARAGEAGRGFAVVAEEIRKLAEQVGQSVKEITDIVVGIQDESTAVTKSLEKGYQEIKSGTHQIKITGEVFEKINNEVVTMVEKINNVSESLNEIAKNSSAINDAGEQIAAISEENSAGIEQTVASVQQQNGSMEIITQNAYALSESANKLNSVIKQFHLH
ncbi:methyl-accepting chemotaxis protein [Clostridiaceae bacterium 35-E11]